MTTEVRCPTDDAGAEATVLPVVAETAAPAEAAVSPVSAITDPAEIAIIFTDGAFIAPSFISGREFDALHVTGQGNSKHTRRHKNLRQDMAPPVFGGLFGGDRTRLSR
ncbi:MAG TPA: hypothetical protein VN847_21440 [Streptosporangiaceae bacterium]|nr:hypothetical protein [Streptosporangiaceae bacterium]